MKYNTFLPAPLFYLLLILCVVVNLAGITTPFFTDDPALYASISKELIYHHTFFELFSYGQHWLDKPHFPFWMAYFSFRIFGISDWAYKLPALLFFLMSLFYTGIFARRYYGRDTAMVAVLIVLTALHVLMSNTDVRAEPYLMGLLIGAVYHLARLNERFGWPHLFIAALFTACAIMTKGVFVLLAVYGALGGQLLLTGKIRETFRPKWLALLLLTTIFVLPETYALYIQFDAHPERTVFQRQNVSGIKFFLWDSQFGRFFNSGPIVRTKGSVFFFVHTLLWAFAPWCLLFFFSLARNFSWLIRRIRLNEYYTFTGGMLLLLLFSLSGFQLPFYTNILFPFFAIVTASVLTSRLQAAAGWFVNISLGIYAGVFVVLLLLLLLLFGPQKLGYFIGLMLALILSAVLIFRAHFGVRAKFFSFCCMVMVAVQVFSLTWVYPTLVKYKGEIAAAKYVNTTGRGTKVFTLSMRRNIFQFYCDREIELCPHELFGKESSDKRAWYLADEEALGAIANQKTPYRIVRTFSNYADEAVHFKFISPQTRKATLGHLYLIMPEK